MDPVYFTNLDDIAVQLTPHMQIYLRSIYPDDRFCFVKLRGIFGSSELAMCCRITENIGIAAFLTNNYTAYVLDHTGKITPGIFHQFPDGTFSLA